MEYLNNIATLTEEYPIHGQSCSRTAFSLLQGFVASTREGVPGPGVELNTITLSLLL